MRANTDTLKNSFVFRTISKWNTLPVSIIHAGSVNAFNSRLTATPQRAASPPFSSWSTWTLGNYHPDPDLHRSRSRIWKRRGRRGFGVRPQDFFGQFRGLFKVFGAKRVRRAPPLRPPLVLRLLQAIRHELQLTIATQTCQQESSTTKEMMTGIPRRLCGYTSPFVNTLRLPHERHLSYHTGVAFAPHNCVIQAWLKANSLKSPPNCLRPKKIVVGGQ